MFGLKQSGLIAKTESGSGNILICPCAWEPASGSWSFATEAGSAHYSFIYNTAPVIGDKLRTYAHFAKGDYSFCLQTTLFSSYGKFEIRIDGVSVYSGDLYSSSVALNTLMKGSFSISSSGIKTIELVCVGKNASATNYYIVHHRLSFMRLS